MVTCKKRIVLYIHEGTHTSPLAHTVPMKTNFREDNVQNTHPEKIETNQKLTLKIQH